MDYKVLIAQGGGPTAVINQSLVGAVLAARAQPGVKAVYGARFGLRGIVNDELLDLTHESADVLEAVAATPCAALGCTRDKPDAAYCARMFKVLQAHGITHFFNIGGNGFSGALHIISEEAAGAGYALRCLHIPKTIDNDLVENDHTPGFPSAARFVAQAFAGVDLDNASLPGVYVGVVMGRDAGFLTAAAAALKTHDDAGPHLIYLPERAFGMEQFLVDVQAVYQRLGRCVVAVSEGVHDAAGVPLLAKLAKPVGHDAHGNVELSGSGALADLLCDTIRTRLGLERVRGDTFGYLQRSFLGVCSDVDAREARGAGEAAVRYAFEDGRVGSVAIQRLPESKYRIRYALLALDAVAGKTRTMPDEFINATANGVTPAFVQWLMPLLGAELPTAVRLVAPLVPKAVS